MATKRRKHYTTKNNHNGSRKFTTYRNSYIVDPYCNVSEFKGYISKEQGLANELFVKKFISDFNEGNLKCIIGTDRDITDKNIVNIILDKVKKSKCGDQYEHGTNLNPLYNDVWVIGFLGSIWLDVEVDSIYYRVALYNEKVPIMEIYIN